MGLVLNSKNFVLSTDDLNLFGDNESDTFEYSHTWENAINLQFKNQIFRTNLEVKINDIISQKILIFYPSKRKSYLIENNKLSYFIDKYFSGFSIVEKTPEFYSFLIPFPDLEYYLENSKITYGDKYNVALGKFKGNTFKSIKNYTLKLNTPYNFDFRTNDFDPIFQRDFQSIFDLSEKYKAYLNLMLKINIDNIEINNLLVPYYKLTTNEIKNIIEIENSINDEIHKQMERDAEDDYDRQYSNWFNSEIDELNRNAFENDSDNYWNID
jgi:hypothetical protein